MSKPAAHSLLAALGFLLGCAKANFVHVEAGASDTGTCVEPDAPTVNCTSRSSNPCDPVCQSGHCNWCNSKCTLAGDGTPVCAGRGSIATGSTCTISAAATAQQHDECVPGDICLTPDNAGAAVSYCFTLCYGQEDCKGNVACAARTMATTAAGIVPTAMVCDPEYTKCDPAAPCCDPLASTEASNGCSSGRFCYLVSQDASGHSRTTCEYSTGGGGRGDPCQSSRDCFEKYVCVQSGAGNSGTCQRVCNTANPCTASTCVAWGAEYGYCPI